MAIISVAVTRQAAAVAVTHSVCRDHSHQCESVAVIRQAAAAGLHYLSGVSWLRRGRVLPAVAAWSMCPRVASTAGGVGGGGEVHCLCGGVLFEMCVYFWPRTEGLRDTVSLSPFKKR